MKAELNIDTKELARELVPEMASRVIEGLKPLLSGKGEEALFTIKTLALYLGVSEKWLYKRVQFHEIPFMKVGGNLRFSKKDIDCWLETLKTPAINPLSSSLVSIKRREASR